jgi:diadenylate cyclase
MIAEFFANLGWRTALDVFLVAVLFYQIIALLKGTRATQVLVGLLVIFLAYLLSSILGLETLNWIIGKFYSSFIFVVIVLFQDDIRRLLTRFGRGPFVSGLDEVSGFRVIDEIVNAAKYLSHDRIGALIVFERGIGLDKLYDHAVRIDSLVSEQILVCIFQSFSPLHDGAVIVQKNRLTCASAQLPLSKNANFSKKLGTRHSAGVGISEETDAVVLIVSEETGTISIAADGLLHKQANIESVRRSLIHFLMPHTEKSGNLWWQNRGLIWLLKKIFPKQVFSNRVPVDLKERTEHSVMEWKSVEIQNRLASSPTHSQATPLKISKLMKSKNEEAPLILKETSQDDLYAKEDPTLQRSSKFDLARAQGSTAQSHAGTPLEILAGASVSSNREDEGMTSGAADYAPMDKVDEDFSPSYSINKAAAALTNLSAEERFVPPMPPSPPPRDVSIGGVSLNPPKEPKTKKEN